MFSCFLPSSCDVKRRNRLKSQNSFKIAEFDVEMAEGSDLIDCILSKVQQDPLAADLQISLFMSALFNYRHDSILRPFPPGYLHDNGEKNIDALRETAMQIPSLKQLSDKKRQLPVAVWRLIQWIINNKNIHVEQVSTLIMFDKITKKTENSGNCPTPSYIFKLKYSDSLNAKFAELCQDMDILYGYHGSRVENFHSIMHNGLHAHLNKTSVFGKGTYLSSDLNVSILYSNFGDGWSVSLLGEKISCIAVCEVIDHPDVKRAVEGPRQRSRSRAENSEAGDVPERYFVVTNNQLVRVKYILVYPCYGGSKLQNIWIFRHPFASLVIMYILCLLLLGLSRTNLFQKLYKRLK